MLVYRPISRFSKIESTIEASNLLGREIVSRIWEQLCTAVSGTLYIQDKHRLLSED